MSKGTTSQDAPFGTLLGYAPGGVASTLQITIPSIRGTTTTQLFVATSTMNTWGINGSAWNLPAVFSF